MSPLNGVVLPGRPRRVRRRGGPSGRPAARRSRRSSGTAARACGSRVSSSRSCSSGNWRPQLLDERVERRGVDPLELAVGDGRDPDQGLQLADRARQVLGPSRRHARTLVGGGGPRIPSYCLVNQCTKLHRMSVLGRSGRLVLGLLLLVLLVLVGAGSPASADDERPVVRVGTEGTYPPFTFHDPSTNELTGYDIEVIKAVADEAGLGPAVRARRPSTRSSRRSTPSRIDVIANQITINRRPQGPLPVLARRTRTRAASSSRRPTTTTSRPSTTSKGKVDRRSPRPATGPQVARDAGADVQVGRPVRARRPSCSSQGRVDVIVNDNIAVLDYLASTGSKDIKIAGNAGDEVSAQALTFRQDEPDLQQQADDALANARRGRHARRDLGEVLRRRRHRGGRPRSPTWRARTPGRRPRSSRTRIKPMLMGPAQVLPPDHGRRAS